MSERLVIDVAAEEAGQRVDQLVAVRARGISRSLAQKLVEAGNVRLADRQVKGSHRLRAGDRLTVDLELPESLHAAPEALPLNVAYEDADLVVVDKPAGFVVHPAPGHESGTLANALVARYPWLGAEDTSARPGLVHRLDKDTSGLMVVALNAGAQASLQEQIRARRMKRQYLALARGHVRPDRGVIDVPIGRDRTRRKVMAAGNDAVSARAARTRYRVLEYLPDFTLLEAALETGRTHQIRVHLAYIGHPIAGDRTYGGPSVTGLERQFLHAYQLELVSPTTGEDLTFVSALPPDLAGVVRQLRLGVREVLEKVPHA